MIIKIQPRGNSSCRASRRINHLAPPWFYISGLLNCERINLCWATKFLINSYTSPRELMHHSRYENRHMRRWKCSPCILSSNLLHAEIPQNVLESQWKQAMLSLVIIWSLKDFLGFPVGWMVKKKKKSTCQCRRLRFDPRIEKMPGEGKSNLPQYSCLKNPMDREAWWATGSGVTKSQIRLGN